MDKQKKKFSENISILNLKKRSKYNWFLSISYSFFRFLSKVRLGFNGWKIQLIFINAHEKKELLFIVP